MAFSYGIKSSDRIGTYKLGSRKKKAMVSFGESLEKAEQTAALRDFYNRESEQRKEQQRQLMIQAALRESQRNPLERFGLEGDPEDYDFVPQTSMVEGYPVPFKEPKIKEKMPTTASDQINLGRGMNRQLETRIEDILGSENIQKRMSPLVVSSHSNFLGNLWQQLESISSVGAPKAFKNHFEWAAFKGQTNQLFQQYRKYITGVQAGFQELKMLEPIFPQATDPLPVYLGKMTGALRTMRENEKQLLDVLNRQGYRTAELRKSTPFRPEFMMEKVGKAGFAVPQRFLGDLADREQEDPWADVEY